MFLLVQCIQYSHASGHEVGVFLVREDPVRYVMGNAWCTALASFAMFEAIYCVFPQVTVDMKQMVVFACDSEAGLRVYEKFKGRGFSRVVDEDILLLDELQEERYAGDFLSRRFAFSGCRVRRGRGFCRVRFDVRDGSLRFHDTSALAS